MSTIRLPPKAVSRAATRPGGLGADLADERGLGAERMRRSRSSALVGRLRRDDRDELALVGDVERVDAEDLAGADDRGPERQRRLLEHDRELAPAGRARSAPSRGRRASGRAASEPPGSELEQRRGQLVDRRGVALELDLELELATRDHHRHAVVAEGARDEHAVARRTTRPAPSATPVGRRCRCPAVLT